MKRSEENRDTEGTFTIQIIMAKKRKNEVAKTRKSAKKKEKVNNKLYFVRRTQTIEWEEFS